MFFLRSRLFRGPQLGQIHQVSASSSPPQIKEDEFKVLNLKNVKSRVVARRTPQKMEVIPPRSKQMPVDQDWGSVWPGIRTFHPATVPLPLRQGYNEKGPHPGKHPNVELMKIPNFLHLTPPVIKRQCEALRAFCTKWPEGLETEEKLDEHFPLQVVYSDYCHSAPTIRNPLSRIVSVRFKLASLKLNSRAKDKFLRLVGERYDEKEDMVTIVTDRCPMRKQNYDYAMYLITALYHESNNVEEWEKQKSEADMELYIWENNASRRSVELLTGRQAEDIPGIQDYKNAVSELMNEGESEYSLKKYGESVRTLLGVE